MKGTHEHALLSRHVHVHFAYGMWFDNIVVYDFCLLRFLDPLLKGDYPDSMKEYVGSRLPQFTSEQIAKVNGSIDFVGINIITAFYAYDYNYYETEYPDTLSYYLDPQAGLTGTYVWVYVFT